MVKVITAADRAAFKRCRRAWDFGSPLRGNWEPDAPATRIDLGDAVRAALAVWYFPGMWEWDRAIVRPLALEAYRRVAAGWPPEQEALALAGDRLLAAYFEWAQPVDNFIPLRVETDFEVAVPDPADPVRDLAGPGGAAVHFAGRIDLLIVDPMDVRWLVEHRVGLRWAQPEALVLDERGAAFCWAWPRSFLGMELAGVIYNELRTDIPPGGDAFRRTPIPRGLVEMERVRYKLGLEARDMTSESLPVYPAPAWDVCSGCRFRPPCIALDTGADADAVLVAGYRPRPPAEVQSGRLGGGTWSMGRGAAPPTFGRGPGPDH